MQLKLTQPNLPLPLSARSPPAELSVHQSEHRPNGQPLQSVADDRVSPVPNISACIAKTVGLSARERRLVVLLYSIGVPAERPVHLADDHSADHAAQVLLADSLDSDLQERVQPAALAGHRARVRRHAHLRRDQFAHSLAVQTQGEQTESLLSTAQAIVHSKTEQNLQTG